MDPALAVALRVLDGTPLIDGHNDLPWAIRGAEEDPSDVEAYGLEGRAAGHTDVARLREGRVGGQFWSVYLPYTPADSGAARIQLEQIDIALQVIARYPETFRLALTSSDVESAFAAGRIASLLGMEGGHAIENSLGALRAFHALGARYMTLTHNSTIDWADAGTDEARHGGLSPFGEEVVREMNRLGMLVDLSHTQVTTMHDALDVSEAPVIYSHASARALTDHPRNVPDEVLSRLPENGGMVMVTFVPGFVSQVRRSWDLARTAEDERLRGAGMDEPSVIAGLAGWDEANPRPSATLAEVADHIDHIRTVAGIDHVGIGGDFDGITSTPVGLEDVSTYPALFAELVRRGWEESDLRKLAGENVLRVMREAEAVAARLQGERGPSTATIDQLDGGSPPAN